MEPGADLGPLVTKQAKQRVLSLVETGVKEGASLLLDGRGLVVPGYENGNFVGPTILHNVQVISGFYFHLVLRLQGSSSFSNFIVVLPLRERCK